MTNFWSPREPGPPPTDYLFEEDLLLEAEVGNALRMSKILSYSQTNINATNHLGRTALHLAAACGSLPCVELALQAKLNPNQQDKLGMTPLAISLMRYPSLAIAKKLFQHGAQITPRTDPMDTGLFLQYVMMCEPTEEEKSILHLLVAQGALVDDPKAPGERQALHFAAMSNNCELISVLCSLGANLYATNHRDETPRRVAISFNCVAAATLLGKLEAEHPAEFSSVTHNKMRFSPLRTASAPKPDEKEEPELSQSHVLDPSNSSVAKAFLRHN